MHNDILVRENEPKKERNRKDTNTLYLVFVPGDNVIVTVSHRTVIEARVTAAAYLDNAAYAAGIPKDGTGYLYKIRARRLWSHREPLPHAGIIDAQPGTLEEWESRTQNNK